MLHSIFQQIWQTLQWPQDWKRSVFIPILKKGNVKKCSNYCTIVLTLHVSKVMLKIFQPRLQQYVNQELPDIQAVFRKGRGIKYQFANIWWIIEKARELQKNIYFCFMEYSKIFDCVDHNKLWKILQEMEYQTALPASWEIWMQVKKQQIELVMEQRTGSKLGNKYVKAVYCHPAYLTYAGYIMWNAGLNEAQVGIKIARRNINNFRYADDTTHMAESEEKLNSLLMKMKEESGKSWLKTHIQKTKIMASGPNTSWQCWGNNASGNNGNSDRFYFLGLQNHCRWWNHDCSHEIKRCLLLGRKVVTNLESILKSRDITLPTKVCLVKAMVFPIVL